MKRFSFGPDDAIVPRSDLLESTTVVPLTAGLAAGAPIQAAVFRLAPGGRIARHEAIVAQILAVLDGAGTVSGPDRIARSIAMGEAVFWAAGEEHETRTDTGLIALIIEGDGLSPPT